MNRINTQYKKLKNELSFRWRTSRLLQKTRNYFSVRPYSLAFFILSILFIVIGVFIESKIYKTDCPKTLINIITHNEDVIIEKADFRIEYNNNGRQTLHAEFTVTSIGESLYGKTVTLLVSDNLTDVGDFYSQDKEKLRRGRYYDYTFNNDMPTSVFSDNFVGNIFGENPAQLCLGFELDPTYDVDQKYPILTNVKLYDLQDVDPINAFPNPKEQNPYSIVFEKNTLHGDNGIFFSATNRVQTNKSQSIVFAIGVGLGVFFSVIVSVLYDLTRYIDEADSSKISGKRQIYKVNRN